MLAFDIETEGLNAKVHRVTVACVYDPDNDIKECFNFVRDPSDPSKTQAEVERFLQRLDDAESLCAFNGVRFDVPFIVQRFQVPHSRYCKWYLKLFDLFEVCKLLFSGTCSLNSLLTENGIPVKVSTGLQAVQWAQQGEWLKLEEYCMADTVLTHQVSTSRPRVVFPINLYKTPCPGAEDAGRRSGDNLGRVADPPKAGTMQGKKGGCLITRKGALVVGEAAGSVGGSGKQAKAGDRVDPHSLAGGRKLKICSFSWIGDENIKEEKICHHNTEAGGGAGDPEDSGSKTCPCSSANKRPCVQLLAPEEHVQPFPVAGVGEGSGLRSTADRTTGKLVWLSKRGVAET